MPKPPAPPKSTIDIIADAVADRLQRPEKDSRWRTIAKTFAHPAALLVLTFVLTTFVGSFLTQRWQEVDRIQQQRRSNAQREIESKYQLIADLTKAVAETTTGAEEALLPAQVLIGTEQRTKEAAERRSYWIASSRQWRIVSKQLSASLNIRFSNPKVHALFEDTVNLRRQLGALVTSVLNPEPASDETAATVKKAIEMIEKMKGQLKTLAGLMLQETRTDEASTTAATSSLVFWR